MKNRNIINSLSPRRSTPWPRSPAPCWLDRNRIFPWSNVVSWSACSPGKSCLKPYASGAKTIVSLKRWNAVSRSRVPTICSKPCSPRRSRIGRPPFRCCKMAGLRVCSHRTTSGSFTRSTRRCAPEVTLPNSRSRQKSAPPLRRTSRDRVAPWLRPCTIEFGMTFTP